MALEGNDAPDFTLESTSGRSVTLSETLDTGPTAVVFNRGYWCSYCAEQLQTFSNLEYDLWRNYGMDVLAVVGDPVPRLVEMRDRFDLSLQLLADPDCEAASRYGGTEQHDSYGEIPLAATYVVDENGVVQYEQVAENAADRTYANYVRHFLRSDMSRPYGD